MNKVGTDLSPKIYKTLYLYLSILLGKMKMLLVHTTFHDAPRQTFMNE